MDKIATGSQNRQRLVAKTTSLKKPICIQCFEYAKVWTSLAESFNAKPELPKIGADFWENYNDEFEAVHLKGGVHSHIAKPKTKRKKGKLLDLKKRVG